MKSFIGKLFCFWVILLFVSFAGNASCEDSVGNANDEIDIFSYTIMSLDADDYDHVFRDTYGDDFYYDEVASTLYGWRLFKGYWEFDGIIYDTTLMYQPSTGVTAVSAEFKNDLNFYYSLASTTTEKYHRGAYAYTEFGGDGPYTKTIQSMHIMWTKGGY